MSTYEWLLFAHVTGAFCLLGGAVAAAVFNVAALRRERPSEIALLLSLTRSAVVAVIAGSFLTLVFGLWLVHEASYGYGDGWIVAAIVLWVIGSAAGEAGGRRDARTRELAERLAAEGDAPSAELAARQRDPLSLALSYGSGAAMLAILVLMVWKPGA
ncbi:MAG TPA: DUF2269 family protein [Gaiellaceae bacterium]